MAGKEGEWGYNERKFNYFCIFEIINLAIYGFIYFVSWLFVLYI